MRVKLSLYLLLMFYFIFIPTITIKWLLIANLIFLSLIIPYIINTFYDIAYYEGILKQLKDNENTFIPILKKLEKRLK